jgi:hypothetical protein
MALSVPISQFKKTKALDMITIYVAIVEVVELQCFFNKSGALAPQSAVNESSMYVLLQTYYLEDL